MPGYGKTTSAFLQWNSYCGLQTSLAAGSGNPPAPDCLPMVLQGWLSQTFHTLQKVQLTLVLFVPEKDYKLTLTSSCYFWCAVLELLRHNWELGNCFMGYLANPDVFI